MSNTIIRHGLILGLFALITSGIIALTDWATRDRIAQQAQQTLITTLNKIIPATQYNNAIANDCIIVNAAQAPELFGLSASSNPSQDLYKRVTHIYRAKFDDKPAALAVETVTPNGYSGNITLLVAILSDNTIGGVRVLEHKETPGLGDKIEERISPWITQFTGFTTASVNDSMWAVKKDNGRFDQFTGATITPRAVVQGVQGAVKYLNEHWQSTFDAANQCGATE